MKIQLILSKSHKAETTTGGKFPSFYEYKLETNYRFHSPTLLSNPFRVCEVISVPSGCCVSGGWKCFKDGDFSPIIIISDRRLKKSESFAVLTDQSA